jgi:hypothetical protein
MELRNYQRHRAYISFLTRHPYKSMKVNNPSGQTNRHFSYQPDEALQFMGKSDNSTLTWMKDTLN